MIQLHSGRVTLSRPSLSSNWLGRFCLSVKDVRLIDLGTKDLRRAYVKAYNYYSALAKRISLEEAEALNCAKAKCWSCLNWLPRNGDCAFEFPEARQTGGRFAARCPLYDNGTESPLQD